VVAKSGVEEKKEEPPLSTEEGNEKKEGAENGNKEKDSFNNKK